MNEGFGFGWLEPLIAVPKRCVNGLRFAVVSVKHDLTVWVYHRQVLSALFSDSSLSRLSAGSTYDSVQCLCSHYGKKKVSSSRFKVNIKGY